MKIEQEIFQRANVCFDKLEKYGFVKRENIYVLERKINDDFKAIICISEKGNVDGKIIDLSLNEEYLGFRTEMQGEFINKIRNDYRNLLLDIKDKCFNTKYFLSNQANRIAEYIIKKYHNEPEFLWDKFKGYGVFRNSDNKKWFSIIMNIDFSKIDKKEGEVEIINVKLDNQKISDLLEQEGFYKAYHMGKKDWISILLNDTLKDQTITNLIDESYDLIK